MFEFDYKLKQQINSIIILNSNSLTLHIHTFTHSHIHKFTHVHFHTFTNSHICSYKFMCYKFIDLHIYTFAHVRYHIFKFTHTHIHIFRIYIAYFHIFHINIFTNSNSHTVKTISFPSFKMKHA